MQKDVSQPGYDTNRVDAEFLRRHIAINVWLNGVVQDEIRSLLSVNSFEFAIQSHLTKRIDTFSIQTIEGNMLHLHYFK
ncbi:MAG: hypothetical protein HWD63_02895 [Candidatus Parvibacillus calidus]|nr:MAG: hypothetical protein HWD63_02895 [Candidatus Parvibacillus calidus]